jgi:hypothetical protein
MALDLSSLRITGFRESLFSRFWWNKTLDKLQSLVSDYVSSNISTPSYKVFSASISQANTDAPTFHVLENTFGVTPVATYANVGTYTLDFGVGVAFPANKTFLMINTGRCSDPYNIYRMDAPTEDSVIRLGSYVNDTTGPGTADLTDGIITNIPIEIRLYN